MVSYIRYDTNCYLSSAGKKNLDNTKAEFKNLEQLKLDVFSNIDVSDDITDNIIYNVSNKQELPQNS